MTTSEDLFARARRVLVGGVNSPARAVEPYPPFIVEGDGPRIRDADDRSYVDLCLAFGPMVVGHAHPDVVAAVEDRVRRGVLFGAPTEEELALAERVAEAVPGADRVRLVNSGTEATMLAIRLARGATGRDGIVKVEGGYHGSSDPLLVKAGSSASWHGVPTSAGVPDGATGDTALVPFNDVGAMEEALDAGDKACVILEPVLANAGLIAPKDGYLEAVRKACDATGTLLVLDEVVTGFRLAPGGAQEHFGVRADLVTLGKALGGGFPVGALCGGADPMDRITPSGNVFNAGTFSGHPVTAAAGLATLDTLADERGPSRFDKRGEEVARGVADLVEDLGLADRWAVHGLGSMACLFFAPGPVVDDRTAKAADRDAFWAFHRAMLDAGVYLPPGQFETWFLSTRHGDAEVEVVLEAAKGALPTAAEAVEAVEAAGGAGAAGSDPGGG